MRPDPERDLDEVIVFFHEEGRMTPAEIERWMEEDERVPEMQYNRRVQRVLGNHYEEKAWGFAA